MKQNMDLELRTKNIERSIKRRMGEMEEGEMKKCIEHVTVIIANWKFLTICELSAVDSASDISDSILKALRNGQLFSSMTRRVFVNIYCLFMKLADFRSSDNLNIFYCHPYAFYILHEALN